MNKRFTSILLASGLLLGMSAPAMAADEAGEVSGSYENGSVTITGSVDDYSMIRVVDNTTGTIIATGTKGEGGELNLDIETGTLEKENGRYEIWINGSNSLVGEGFVEFPEDEKPGTEGGNTGSSSGGNKSHNTIIPATAGGTVSTKTGSHGSVSISPKNPSKGDKVTITVKPDDGYELDSIRITADGTTIQLTDEGDNVYSFTMPGGDVTITTSFKLSEGSEPAFAAPAFRDVASTDWFANAVAFVAERGMMAGNNGLFSPNDNLTRSMMAQILYNVEGGAGFGTRTFPDVTSSDWFAGAVSWAASQGLMDGYGNGNFGPNDSITREQLASILYRYAGVKGYSTGASAELGSFVDGASTSSWAAESVRWAVGSGLLTGKSGSRLDPTGTATRAEVAQILMNFYTQVAN